MGLGKVFQRLFTPMADIRNALEGGGVWEKIIVCVIVWEKI